jgi:hypothetical protein
MTRVYRFRVFDARDGSELARWDAAQADDADAVSAAVELSESLGIMVDELRCVDGECPIEGLEPGQWRAIEILREVVVI